MLPCLVAESHDRTANRLRDLIGDDAYRQIDRLNFYPEPVVWDAGSARMRAEHTFRLPGGKGRVLLMGSQRLAKAFGVEARYFEPCLLRRRVCYVIPHPHGARWYSVEINHHRAKRFFAALLLAMEGVQRPDGYLDAREFVTRAKHAAREAGRVFA